MIWVDYMHNCHRLLTCHQRDTHRLRWEYAAHQHRELAHTSRDLASEDTEKLYRQAAVGRSQTVAETVSLASIEQTKASGRDSGASEKPASGMELLSAQYGRHRGEDHAPGVSDGDYEEGELRPESHKCALCACKFLSMDMLISHMEKHRVAFERSCSVCQLGTLKGNMLLLHMEASHGPETNYHRPSSSAAVSSISTTVSETYQPLPSSAPAKSALVDFTQSFSGAQKNIYSSQISGGASSLKLPQYPHSPGHAGDNHESSALAVPLGMKSEVEDSFNYSGASTSRAGEAELDSDNVQMMQDNFLGFSSQFYPLIGCQVCGEKFALSEALDAHVESQHKDTLCTYTCKPCCLSFHSHVEYSRHMSRHDNSSSNLKCSHCLKSFKSVKQLRLHYVAAHACCHFCEYCRAGFPDAMSLQLHEQLHTLDPEKLTFRCDICSKAFYTQSQCSAHKRTHKDEKAHACELCGSAFFKRGDLTKHVRTVHSPSRLFACKFCGKKGTRMDNMRSHVRSHHKNMSRDQIINMIEVIE